VVYQDVVPVKSAADWWSVAETTMWAGEVVVLEPGQEVLVAFLGVGPMASIGPFAKCGLNETFRFSVGAWRIRPREAMANAEFGAGVAELVRAIAASVVREQTADPDAVLGIKSDGVV
jgi:hypothetical protein